LSPKSSGFAEAVANEFFVGLLPENRWQVRLDDQDRLIWKTGDAVMRKDPARTL